MLAVAAGLVAALFAILYFQRRRSEAEKRRLEGSIRALSELNLSAGSQGTEDLEAFSMRALERVLRVVQASAGALIIRGEEDTGKSCVAVSGFREPFQAALGKADLAGECVKLVTEAAAPLPMDDLQGGGREREPGATGALMQLEALLARDGIETAVGIRLMSQGAAKGALLMGQRSGKRFTPAEVKLLEALGQQIGAAVENNRLLQQTARRDKELRVLNEIGHVLSRTLDTEALLTRIHEELKRLFNVGSFFLALFVEERNEIRFELEMVNGVRKPKRWRPAGKHLSEHIIRTRQALLVREGFREVMGGLGIESLRQTGSFCGVPLVLYDRAFGVMALYSEQERAFDERHLELLKALAGEAGIALENARLFSEERKKAQHLALFNNVSRHAITTLNPDEMLANIAREMEQSLSYSHVGIAILDYATKELVIQAAGGKAMGTESIRERRLPLDAGLLGRVARSGQMATLQVTETGSASLLREESRAGIAMPITYADQLLGVLYAESDDPREFTEEETQLLQTLADLVAGALHNAMTFQRAQEQAITDGLTGLKTHRFFMESLSAEWKRATRAGRAFSVVLIDLDRFKFVNDFYGHLEGDVVLQRVAQILEQNCRRSDVVARYGGDEFVVLMPETNLEQAQQRAAKLRGCMAGDALLHEKNITGSFGLAGFPWHGSTPQELIQAADSSMYLSKHQGGNAVSVPESGKGTETGEARQWKRDVLEAYLGVALKRLFTTGPEAFEEIYRRLEQFMSGLVKSRESGLERSEAPSGATELPAAVIEMLTSLALAIDAKDHYTQGHSRKVSALAVQLAEALGLADDEIEQVRLAGLLHDIGKVGIHEGILNKAGPLNSEEWEQMKAHPRLGWKMLEPLRGLGAAKVIQDIVKHHHEYWDGSGYPEGLAGAGIPVGARIVAIADAYDTITSDRTYKRGRSAAEAEAELERCAGTQFDARLVQLFVEALRSAAIGSKESPEAAQVHGEIPRVN